MYCRYCVFEGVFSRHRVLIQVKEIAQLQGERDLQFLRSVTSRSALSHLSCPGVFPLPNVKLTKGSTLPPYLVNHPSPSPKHISTKPPLTLTKASTSLRDLLPSPKHQSINLTYYPLYIPHQVSRSLGEVESWTLRSGCLKPLRSVPLMMTL